MTRADLLALADRAEREEPNDRLDCNIWNAIGCPIHVGELRYTHSIDDAASLVPAAWVTDNISDLDDPGGAWSCRLSHRLLPHNAWGNAPTEPRARTAAALRARAMEMKDE